MSHYNRLDDSAELDPTGPSDRPSYNTSNNQKNNQTNNPSNNRSINQLDNASSDESFDRSNNQLTNQSFNQSNNQPQDVLNKSYISIWFNQLVALSIKNFQLWRGQPYMLCVILLLPSVAMILMILINIIGNNQSSSQSGQSSPSNVLFEPCRSLDAFGVVSASSVPCISLVYSPSNNQSDNPFDEIMSTVVAGTSLAAEHDVMGYSSEWDLFNDWNQNYGQRDVAVVFTNNPSNNQSVNLSNNQFSYRIHYNLTLYDQNRIATLEYLVEHAIANWVIRNVSTHYPLSDIQPFDDWIDQSINQTPLRVVDQTSIFYQSLSVPASPQSSNQSINQLQSTMDFIGGPFIILIGSIIALIVCQLIAQEKRLKLLPYLRMNGLIESAYWMSYIITMTFLLFWSALFAAIVMKIQSNNQPNNQSNNQTISQFQNVDFFVQFTWLWFSLICMTSSGIFLSSLAVRPMWLNLLSFNFFGAAMTIAWMFTIMMQYPTILSTFYDQENSPAGTFFMGLFPFFHVNKVWQDISVNSQMRQVTNMTKLAQFWPCPSVQSINQSINQTINQSILDPVCGYPGPGSIGMMQQLEYPFSKLFDTQMQLQDDPGTLGSTTVNTNCNWFDSQCCDYLSQPGIRRNYWSWSDPCYIMPSSAASLGYMLLLTAFYVFLAWYIGQIGDELGGGKKFYFLFQPSYWRGEKSGNQSNDQAINQSTVTRARDESARDRSINTVKLSKVFNGVQAVKEVSLKLEPGEIFTLLGANGSGKSTTINLLTGSLTPTNGDGFICGQSINQSNNQNLIGVCPQADILWPTLTVEQHMKVQCAIRRVNKQSIDQSINQSIDLMGLSKHLRQMSSQLSGGEKRRLSMGLALIGNPHCLILDEPTTGMDAIHRAEVWRAINLSKKDRIVLLTTHAMEEAAHLSDKVAIMASGRVRAQGSQKLLKQLYGEGFELRLWINQSVNQEIDHSEWLFSQIIGVIERMLPRSRIIENNGVSLLNVAVKRSHIPYIAELLKEINNLSITHSNNLPNNQVIVESAHLSPIGQSINQSNNQLVKQTTLREWSLSNSTLEEVFVHVCMADVTVNSGGRTDTDDETIHQSNNQSIKCKFCHRNEPVDVVLYTASGVPIRIEGVLCESCSLGPQVIDPQNSQLAGNDEQKLSSQSTSNQPSQNPDQAVDYSIDESNGNNRASYPLYTPQPVGELIPPSGDETSVFPANQSFKHRPITQSTYQETPLDHMGRAPASNFSQIRAIFLKNWASLLTERIAWIVRVIVLIILMVIMIEVAKQQSSGGLYNGQFLCPQGQVSIPWSTGQTCDPASFYQYLFLQPVQSQSVNDWMYQSNVVSALIDGTEGSINQSINQTNKQSTNRTFSQWDIGRGAGLLNDSLFDRTGGSASQLEWQDWSSRIVRSSGQTIDQSVHNQWQNNFLSAMQLATSNPSMSTINECDSHQLGLFFSNQLEAWSYAQANLPYPLIVVHDDQSVMQPTAQSYDQDQAQQIPGQSRFSYTIHYADAFSGFTIATSLTPNYQAVERSIDESISQPLGYISCTPTNTWQAVRSNMTNQYINGLSRTMMYSAIRQSTSYPTPPSAVGPMANQWTRSFDPTINVYVVPVPNLQFSSASVLIVGAVSGIAALASLLLLPWLIDRLVIEREEKLYWLMRMSGMRSINYWIGNYLFDFLMMNVWMAVILICGYASGSFMFQSIQPAALIILSVVWSHALVCCSWLLGCLFTRRLFASLVMYGLMMCLAIWTFMWDAFLYGSIGYPSMLGLFPPFAYLHALGLLLRYQGGFTSTINEAILILFFGSTAYMLLAVACQACRDMTLTQIKSLVGYGSRKQQHESSIEQSLLSNHNLNVDASEDEEIRQEREDVINATKQHEQSANGAIDKFSDQYAIIINNLSKTYIVSNWLKRSISRLMRSPQLDPNDRSNQIRALKGLHLGVKYGETLAFIGQNGAGKSTCLSILCGLLEPTTGDAYIAGQSVNQSMKQSIAQSLHPSKLPINFHLGICCQEDYLFPDLTVFDHLLLFARLRGASPAMEYALALHVAELVGLDGDPLNNAAGKLSGGQMRRLSLALSLMGNPAVWLLDEPSTGLSVEARRDIYAIIRHQQARPMSGTSRKRAIVLTTHSMEEADLLCSRIAIVAAGHLAALGTQAKLKQRHGQGDKLMVHFLTSADTRQGNALRHSFEQIQRDALDQTGPNDYLSKFIRFVHSDISAEAKLFSIQDRKVEFSLSSSQSALSDDVLLSMFARMDSITRQLAPVYHVEEWSLSHASLEEAFIEIVQNEDKKLM